MDPLTQGALGAALPAATARRPDTAGAALLGFLAGMSADLDVLIRSSTDPLLFLEYHRQFTHALIFIPLGGLLSACLLHGLIGRRRGFSFTRSALFCTLGYATHAVLDACTTYGTQLFWPFSDARIAWNIISIIDPLFTVPLLFLVLLAAWRRRPGLAASGMVWAIAYLSLGLWQRDQAVAMGRELAAERGHQVLHLEAKPSFANVVLWKVVYETADRFYVDAVRTSPAPLVYPGESVARLHPPRDLPWLDPTSQQARDVQRFSWFSNGYVALDPGNPYRVMDIRYSLLPNEIAPLWSIELDPSSRADAHVAYLVHRQGARQRLGTLWELVTGTPSSGGEYRLGRGDGRTGFDGRAAAADDDPVSRRDQVAETGFDSR